MVRKILLEVLYSRRNSALRNTTYRGLIVFLSSIAAACYIGGGVLVLADEKTISYRTGAGNQNEEH